MCNPCVRYEMLPMSRAAQPSNQLPKCYGTWGVRPAHLIGHPSLRSRQSGWRTPSNQHQVLWNMGVSAPPSSDTRACAQGKVIRVANNMLANALDGPRRATRYPRFAPPRMRRQGKTRAWISPPSIKFKVARAPSGVRKIESIPRLSLRIPKTYASRASFVVPI